MRIRPGWGPPLTAAVVVAFFGLTSALPNATKSFFPSSPSDRSSSSSNVDITTGNSEPYLAVASEFFPTTANKGLKFPGASSSNQNEQRVANSAPSSSSSSGDIILPLEMGGGVDQNSDEAAADEAIDIVLRSARSGKSMDLGGSGSGGGSSSADDLAKVASDPIIQQQLASGNEVEARGYIRNKLCGLGLMPCGPPHHGGGGGGYYPGGGHGLRPVGHGGGGYGGGGWGPGIPAKDVTLVQPVALKPVGHPIAAVPLEKGHGGHHGGYGHGGGHHHASYAKQYGPPPPGPPPPHYHPVSKPIYSPGPGPIPLRPQYGPPPHGGGGGGYGGVKKPLVEHVHHHIHHTPSTSGVNIGGSSGYGNSVYGQIGIGDEYGLGAKNPISIANPPGNSGPLPALGTPHHNGNGGGGGSYNNGVDYNRVEECTCVRLAECANFDIISSAGSSGNGVISGLGGPNYGQVGFGIDPRNKITASAIESNATTLELVEGGGGGASEEEEVTEVEEETQGRGLGSSIEALSGEEEEMENATTTTPTPERRRRRDVTQIQTYGGQRPKRNQMIQNQNMGNHQMSNENPEVMAPVQVQQPHPQGQGHDEDVAASGDGNSEPRHSASASVTPAQGEGRLIGGLLRDSDMLKNLTRFAGYDFGDDPTQLVRIDGQQLRIFGKLFGMEPTVGVSFGLPGGNHGGVGGYAPHLNPHLGVNPYQDGGISLGPINVNPLVSFQKGKDKHKTKIFRPLVNLHITPNFKVFKGIKALLTGKGGWGWGAPEYNYGWGWPQQQHYYQPHPHPPPHHVEYVPYPHPVEVPVPVLPDKVKHHHDHFHTYPQREPEVIYSSGGGTKGWSSSYSHPVTSSFTVGTPAFSSSSSLSSSSGGYGGSSSYPSTGYGNYLGGGSGGGGGGLSTYGSGYGGYTKFDKMGAATGTNPLFKATSDGGGGIFGGIREGISSLLDTVSGAVGGGGSGSNINPGVRGQYGGGGGIRNQASGLTPNEENLLNTLLKEEGVADDGDIESLTNSRYRSGPFVQDQVGGGGGGGGYNSNSGGGGNRWGLNSVRGGRTLFPEDTSNSKSNNGGGKGGAIFPAGAHTRLPPNAYSQSSSSISSSSSSSSSPIIFEDDGGESGRSSFSQGTTNDGKMTFPGEGEARNIRNNGGGGDGGKTRRRRRDTTDVDSDMEVEARANSTTTTPTTPTNSLALPEARNNHQRQLNIGGSCPGGYVCCRSPRQQNTQNSFNSPSGAIISNGNYAPNGNYANGGGHGGQLATNQFQQLAPSPFQQNQNSIQHLPGQGPFNLPSSGGQNPFGPGGGQCGKRNARGITGRVTNPGHVDGDTDYGEYPWQVAILKKDGYDNVYVCGGALIDSRHILTAAHCIKGHSPKEIRVRLGEWDVNHETEFYPHLERDVAEISLHPDFYAGNLFNDLAIVTLEGFVDFRQNPHISPVCIPPPTMDFSGQRCYVTGWGKDAFGVGGKYQNVLKEVDLPVLSHFECEQRLKRTRLGGDFTLHPGFLCAGGEEGKDACKGDGGGPLVCETGAGVWQVGGIVSWGVGCGQAGVPGVYVAVAKYNDWIQKVISRS